MPAFDINTGIAVTINVTETQQEIGPITNTFPVIEFINGSNIVINSTGGVISFNSRTGVVVSQAWDYDADQVDYDNLSSGLSSTNVQGAIDEIAWSVPVSWFVESFNWRQWVVTPLASDYDADQVDYDNTTSGLTATEVQAAIDEVEARVDSLESLWRFRGVHDASTGVPPTPASSTVLPGQPINAGDRWRVSVAGTIPWLGWESTLEVGDLIIANIDNAVTAADFTGLDTNSGSEQFTTTVALAAGANVINHNLGTQYNTVTVINQATGNEVNFITKNATSANTLTLNTFAAFTARVIVISGFN